MRAGVHTTGADVQYKRYAGMCKPLSATAAFARASRPSEEVPVAISAAVGGPMTLLPILHIAAPAFFCAELVYFEDRRLGFANGR